MVKPLIKSLSRKDLPGQPNPMLDFLSTKAGLGPSLHLHLEDVVHPCKDDGNEDRHESEVGFGELMRSPRVGVLEEEEGRLPAVKLYQKKGLVHYEILGDIFNNTTSTGRISYSFSQVPLPSDEDREIEDIFINSGVHVNVDVEAVMIVMMMSDDDEVDQTEISNKKKGKRPSRSIGSSSNRCKNKWDSMDSYFETAKEVMQTRLKKVKIKSAEYTAKSCEQFFVTECMETLESLGDIDGDIFNKFTERIIPCIEWRKVFLAMSEARK
ncbi:hypothetical protein LWI29_027150 [Acer saccharum]|uniref:Uncharacterized protein n=1 Tax=Acer saccharum TaxID=4024 RepID=A0AA39SM89_ACESA|nr:hypothetical protein LWI29_027150 [Acer saccharum]